MADKKLDMRPKASPFSDFVLCLASSCSILISKGSGYYGVIGFFIIAVASGLGVLPISALFPSLQGEILSLRRYFSFLSSASGRESVQSEVN